MFARIHSSWQVLGYTTYSVSLQPDPQFVEGPTLYMYPLHVQCVFPPRSTVNGRCYVIPPTCVVCISTQIHSSLEVLCYTTYCVYSLLLLDPQFMIDPTLYMNLTTIKPVLYQRKLRPGKGLALVRFVWCCTCYRVFSRERHKPQLLCLC